MARNKGNSNREPAETADLLDEVLDGEGLNPALESIYGEMGIGPDGQDATVYISKALADGREARVWQGDPSDYDLMEVAKKHGSGDYRVKVYIRIKSGQRVPAPGANRVFPIQLTPDEDARVKAARENPASLLPQAAGNAQVMTAEAIARIVADTVKATLPQQQPDPFAGIRVMAEVMKAMPNAATVPQAAPNPLAGINMGDIIKTVFGMAGEVARMKSGAGGDAPRRGANTSDIWINLINKFGEPLLNALYANRMPGGVPVIPAQPQPKADQPAIQPEGNAPMQNNAPMDDESRRQLQMGIAFLVAQADSGRDPATYANVVEDAMPGDTLDRILSMDDPVAFIAQFDPRVNEPQRRAWFSSLIDELLEPDEPEGGNAPD